jgi:hypothetical protein
MAGSGFDLVGVEVGVRFRRVRLDHDFRDVSLVQLESGETDLGLDSFELPGQV